MKRCAIYTRTATPDSYPCESQREVKEQLAEAVSRKRLRYVKGTAKNVLLTPT